MDLVEQYNRDKVGFISKDLFQWLHLVDKDNLKDGSEKSRILRELLREVSIEELEKFSGDCIDEKGPDAGMVLQDLVSEVGRRIGFEIEYGKYRKCPYDGIWKTSDSGGRTIVLEVKKNTTYQIDIKKLESARKDIVNDRYHMLTDYQPSIRFMYAADRDSPEIRAERKRRILQADQYRGENFGDIFPLLNKVLRIY